MQPDRFTVKSQEAIASAQQILTKADAAHGGALLAVATAALEATTGRPLVWVTGQFLSHAAM